MVELMIFSGVIRILEKILFIVYDNPEITEHADFRIKLGELSLGRAEDRLWLVFRRSGISQKLLEAFIHL
ncbi:hypothetical protein ACFLU6_10895 [Acidobacteriota bacterium]